MAETRTPGDTTGEEQAEEDQRDHDLPGARGLYDPRFEHDACGIGFVVDIAGRPSSRVIRQALTVLRNLDHRGARGAEPDTGDGAGILLQIPDRFLRRTAAAAGSSLPPAGAYGTGVFFLPQNAGERETCQATIDALVRAAGLEPLYWRAVPTDNTTLGASARGREPSVSQLLVSAGSLSGMALERRLYVIRRRVEKALRPAHADFYVASFSHRTLVYKGMLTPVQLDAYYSDLREPDVASALALVHARFSTNTFPSWQRAHPNRYLIHNGEINTLRGNINWMRAREALFSSPHFGDALEELLPVIDETGSDSAMFDNVLEFLVLAGRSLPHAIMMMIPEPWPHHESMDDARRAFYEYHSCLLESWDGPAAIAFSDGVSVGAVLDRNGLRPARYVVTIDGRVIMASESGVLPIPPEEIEYKGRLQPGRMLLIDTARGAIVSDEELKAEIAAAHPYRAWLDEHLVELEALPPETESGAEVTPPHTADLVQLQQAHGYTFEDVRLLLAPMAEHGVEPVGSMGDDTPPALLSARPRLVFDYFKQLFAQVTNPPIDAIREALVMGSEILLGSEGNLLRPAPEGCRRIRLQTPVLTDGELARIRAVRRAGFRAVTLPTLFPAAGGVDELELALAGLCTAAEEVVRAGANLLILSDRGLARPYAAIPALLATGAVHHHLIRRGLRTRASLLVESGEPREVHHVATLLGYGAEAANPYLAFATIRQQLRKGMVTGLSEAEAERHYRKALTKGIVKTISKMGISTLQSYHGAQVFEALGLHPGVVDRYFTGTPSRIGGARLETIAEETLARHHAAFPERPANGSTLPVGGRYQWREDGEFHLFNPATVHRLQRAVRSGDEETYRAYAQAVDEQSNATLRSYLTFKEAPEPLPLEEVEPVAAILKRFKTGAMSFGSISREAHETLAIAMNRIGGRSNSGEGGEDPARYVRDENGDWRRSAIKQVASGRFGVTSEYLVNAEELQIKISQGAKPGEGGQLPGSKVYPWIARVRYSTPGVGLISPPPHHDIYSIEDLAQLIFDLKNANPAARVSVKLVSAVGVGTIAAGVAKGHADVILISGADGGTGASPQSSIKHAGLPWELGLAETQQTLVMNNLRDRVVLETDGQLRTGRDVAIAALLGAEEFGFATAPLVALGCIMMRVCHLDTCPVGIATQNPELRRSFPGDPQHIVNFMTFIAEDLRRWMARLGFRTVAQMVGRCDRLVPRTDNDHWKARGLDLSRILYQPATPREAADRDKRAAYSNGHPLSLRNTLDQGDLLQRCRPALEEGRPVRATLPIRNVHRAVGTTLGSEVTRRYGAAGLPPDTIRLHFKGSAGQSFGAFVPPGLTLIVEGDTNDYLGKGLSGGRIIVFPPREATFAAEENVIAGNVAFYGATAGEAYIRGVAGERFCVRNSGAHAVVEGIGDHGCEYMTGGRVVVLGATGRNFAAGMSGGIAYVLDEKGYFASCCNREMVDLERLADPAEIAAIKSMIRSHTILTGSKRGREILSRWNSYWPRFYRVIPRDYRRVLETVAAARANGFDGEKAIMAAFDANKREGARASGN